MFVNYLRKVFLVLCMSTFLVMPFYGQDVDDVNDESIFELSNEEMNEGSNDSEIEDTAENENKKKPTFGKSNPQQEQEMLLKQKLKEERQQKIDERKSLRDTVRIKKKELSEMEKQLKDVIDSIIISLTEEEINELRTERDRLLFEKANIEKEIFDLEEQVEALTLELKEKDDGFVPVEGTLNWNKIFDISSLQDRKPGVWNVTVRAKDSMNNYSEEESINIKVDPKSDFPTVNIISPKQDGRVPGNLMVVGTAYDDDGVDRVEMYLNNETEPRACTGTEFWYYELDTTEMNDGIHSLRFKVYDINGLESDRNQYLGGRPYKVDFVLDRKVPVIGVESLTSGAIVSGKVRVAGNVIDDNGIVSMEYSLDDRYSYNRVSSFRSTARGKVSGAWAFTLDTGQLIDGTQTVWIKALDGAGSEGFFPLTVTVDHDKPEVGFQYPEDKAEVGEFFELKGFTRDNVDIKSVNIDIKGTGAPAEQFPVEVLPGNPFWKFRVNVKELFGEGRYKPGSYKFTATAEDVAGNTASETITLNLSTELEKPVLELKSISKDQAFANFLPVFGPVSDDEAVKSVSYKIIELDTENVAVERTIDAFYSFYYEEDIRDLKEGKYRIELTPEDEYMQGDIVTESFWIDRSYPKFDKNEIDEKWAGKVFSSKISLPLTVIKYGDLKGVSYKLYDGISDAFLSEGDLGFSPSAENQGYYIVDPLKLDYSKEMNEQDQGLRVVDFTAIDNGGKKSTIKVPFIVDFMKPTITPLQIDDKTGMVNDDSITVDDNMLLKLVRVKVGGDDFVDMNIGDEQEFVLPTTGDDGKKTSYDILISAEDLAGNTNEYKYKIRFKDTVEESHILTINVASKDNTIFGDEPRLFHTDGVTNPDIIEFVYGFVPYNTKVTAVVDNGENISVRPNNNEYGIFSYKIDKKIREGFKQGENVITLSREGDEFRKVTYFNDLNSPSLKVIWPPAYSVFNDTVTLYANVVDDSAISKVEYTLNLEEGAAYRTINTEDTSGVSKYSIPNLAALERHENQQLSDYISETEYELLENSRLFKLDLPMGSEGENTVKIRVTDTSGRITERVHTVYCDKTPPLAEIMTPQDQEGVNGTITIRGNTADDYMAGPVVLDLNGTNIVTNGFPIWEEFYNLYARDDVNPEEMNDVERVIDVYAYDMAGNKTKLSKNVIIDTASDVPEVFINSPSLPDQRYTGVVELGGVALDDDAIEYVEYRIDKGLVELGEDQELGVDSWNRIVLEENNPNWYVKIEQELLNAGRHLLEVRAFDIYGLESETKEITFQLDKENPVIDITGPANGSYLKGLRLISGSAFDPNEISHVEVSTNNGWTFVPTEGKENWRYFLDTTTLPDGPLNFLIKAVDLVGSESFSFAVYNIDNTPPEVDVLLPKDNMKSNNKYRIIGRAKDNVEIESIHMKVTNGSRNMLSDTDDYGFVEVEGKNAWHYDIDTTDWLNLVSNNANDTSEINRFHLIVKVYDKAGNETKKSLDFIVDPMSDLPVVEIDQPQSGQHLAGDMIEFYGTSHDDDGIARVLLKIDDREEVVAEGTTMWKYMIPSVELEPGAHRVVVVAEQVPDENGNVIKSGPVSRVFYVDEAGVVIRVLSHDNGQAVEHRPWVKGSASYYERDLELKIKKQIQLKKFYELKKKLRRTPEKIPEIDDIEVKVFEVRSEMNKYLSQNRIKAVHMSIDNGKTFSNNLLSPENWQIRLQTQLLPEGPNMIQFKAITKSGKETLKYFKLNIDRQIPEVIIDKPEENRPVNGEFVVRGSADDNNDVDKVEIRMKRFDKNLGKMPAFIQGIYLWAQVFGGPMASGGIGFSFFDSIVRLEALFGWIPTQENLIDMGIAIDDPSLFSKDMGWANGRYEPRFSGFATGGKLLARILDIPFEFFGGEDFRNFSISVEVGAGFYWMSGFAGAASEVDGSYYKNKRLLEGLSGLSSDTYGYDPYKDSKVLAGFMYQIDFFKVADYGILKDFAFYFENSFYFIASEVESTLTPQFGFGIRNSLF